MNWIEALGYFAAFCTTISFLPQTIKTIKTKDTSGLSLYMYLLFFIGVGCWFFYGYVISNYPLMIANGLTLFLSGIILIMKLKHK
ncbi:MAG: SemiSWEET transporter [Saprospiraceae bacterium]|jgi:MtN3 and saliva related transmembrane protein|nr:SemiSWEET transporter [Saprospiraceae bacterium]MDA9181725.1 SemiSWEET transporter [Saprospiraceae bacterium]HAV28783.1 hypothetical protein [Saprospirales bacterium]